MNALLACSQMLAKTIRYPYISFPCSRSQEKSSPSKMYSHGTSRPKTTSSVNSLTSEDHFPTCFEHVGLFLVWAFLSCLLCSCYSFLSIKRKLSDYLLIKMLFIDFQGNLKETCVQRSPGHFPKVTVIYRFNCIMCQIVLGFWLVLTYDQLENRRM